MFEITAKVGSFLHARSERFLVKALESKYGKQIGKTAKNGNMTFKKQKGNKWELTGTRWNGTVIAQVKGEGDVLSGTAKRIVKNSDGDIVEVSHVRQATNYRKNVRENLETGEVDSRTLRVNPQNQYVVEHIKIDKHGAVTSTTTPVKIKGKSSPLDKVEHGTHFGKGSARLLM